MKNHPQIQYIFEEFQQEKNSEFRRVHRLIDLFEVIIKTYTASIMGIYFQREASESVKELLIKEIKRPSLGTWQSMSRIIMTELLFPQKLSPEQVIILKENLNNPLYLSELYDDKDYTVKREKIFLETLAMSKEAEAVKSILLKYEEKLCAPLLYPGFYSSFFTFDDLISHEVEDSENLHVIGLRNKYAHGAVPSEEQCKRDIELFEDVLNKLMALPFFNQTEVIVFQQTRTVPEIENIEQPVIENIEFELNTPYLHNKRGEFFPLKPIMLYQVEGNRLLFFNDIPNKTSLSLLHYPSAEHKKDKEFYREFLKIIQLDEWQNQYIKDDISASLELEYYEQRFVGRQNWIDKIDAFIESDFQHHWLCYGDIGIGKSALASHIFLNLRKQKSKIPAIFKFSAFRDQTPLKKFYESLHVQLTGKKVHVSDQLTEAELAEEILLLLKRKSLEASKQHKKIVVILDGLDEVSHILNYLPNQVITNCSILYFSRRHFEVQKFEDSFTEQPVVENLNGLSLEDIRTLLWATVSKYELDHKEYIKEIEKVSNGNALYVYLLCQALEQQTIQKNNLNQLPEQMSAMYQRALQNLMKDTSTLHVLIALASVEREITKQELDNILEIDCSKYIEELYAFLHIADNRIKLFHLSLREFIQSHYPEELLEMHERIVGYCRRTVANEDPSKLYAYEYYSFHLKSVYERANIVYKKELRQEIAALVNNLFYEKQQNKYVRNKTLRMQIYVHAIEMQDSLTEIDSCIHKMLAYKETNETETQELFEQYTLSEEGLEDLLLHLPLVEEQKRVAYYTGLLLHQVTRPNNDDSERMIHALSQESKNLRFDKFFNPQSLLQLEERLNCDLSPIIERANWSNLSLIMSRIDFKQETMILKWERFFKVADREYLEFIEHCINANQKDLANRFISKLSSDLWTFDYKNQSTIYMYLVYFYDLLGMDHDRNRLLFKYFEYYSKARFKLFFPKADFSDEFLAILLQHCKRIKKPEIANYFNWLQYRYSRDLEAEEAFYAEQNDKKKSKPTVSKKERIDFQQYRYHFSNPFSRLPVDETFADLEHYLNTTENPKKRIIEDSIEGYITQEAWDEAYEMMDVYINLKPVSVNDQHPKAKENSNIHDDRKGLEKWRSQFNREYPIMGTKVNAQVFKDADVELLEWIFEEMNANNYINFIPWLDAINAEKLRTPLALQKLASILEERMLFYETRDAMDDNTYSLLLQSRSNIFKAFLLVALYSDEQEEWLGYFTRFLELYNFENTKIVIDGQEQRVYEPSIMVSAHAFEQLSIYYRRQGQDEIAVDLLDEALSLYTDARFEVGGMLFGISIITVEEMLRYYELDWIMTYLDNEDKLDVFIEAAFPCKIQPAFEYEKAIMYLIEKVEWEQHGELLTRLLGYGADEQIRGFIETYCQNYVPNDQLVSAFATASTTLDQADFYQTIIDQLKKSEQVCEKYLEEVALEIKPKKRGKSNIVELCSIIEQPEISEQVRQTFYRQLLKRVEDFQKERLLIISRGIRTIMNEDDDLRNVLMKVENMIH